MLQLNWYPSRKRRMLPDAYGGWLPQGGWLYREGPPSIKLIEGALILQSSGRQFVCSQLINTIRVSENCPDRYLIASVESSAFKVTVKSDDRLFEYSPNICSVWIKLWVQVGCHKHIVLRIRFCGDILNGKRYWRRARGADSPGEQKNSKSEKCSKTVRIPAVQWTLC